MALRQEVSSDVLVLVESTVMRGGLVCVRSRPRRLDLLRGILFLKWKSMPKDERLRSEGCMYCTCLRPDGRSAA